jgi:hypothetical protein
MAIVKMNDALREQILGAIRAGVHPTEACTAAGLDRCYMYEARRLARNGSATSLAFLEAVAQASALAEVDDVLTTKRAAKVETVALVCPECKAPFHGDPVQLANVLGAAETAQRVKASAAGIAMTRLERRFSQRWSQRVVHTVQEEHERLLNVAERILAPEVFELLLEEYISSNGGEDAPEDDQGPAPRAGVH